MSGPKVVRIVTREELIDICRGHLARVDAAIAEWTRIGRRNDCIVEADLAALENRRAELAGLLAADRFMDLQKQAPAEIAFLEQDMERRLGAVAEKAAAARSIERRQARAAAALLAELGKAGIDPPPALKASLESAARGSPDPAAMSAGFELLSQRREHDDGEAQALAARYSEGLSRRSYADWLEVQPERADPLIASLDAKLAELGLFGPEQAEQFEARLRMIEQEEGPRRSLLIDSFSLDLSGAVANARARQKVHARLLHAKAEIEMLDPVLWTPLAKRLTADATLEALEQVLAEADEIVAQVRAAKVAAQRRKALIEGLGALGYEVAEGLETAWAEMGTLVVRNAERPEYGMEVNGDLASDRAQMRAVTFRQNGPTGEASDFEAETLWCGDVAKLQEELSRSGVQLTIERATPAGQVPLRVAARPAADVRRQAREGRSQDLKSRQ